MQPVSEPDEYKGLVYYDGVDSLGRPVVIVNADALPRSASRKAAVHYLLQRLEPIVTQVSMYPVYPLLYLCKIASRIIHVHGYIHGDHAL